MGGFCTLTKGPVFVFGPRAEGLVDIMPDHARPMQFLTGITRIDPGHPGLIMVLAQYDEATFQPGLFAQRGITLPHSIAAATPRRQCEFLAGRALAAEVLAQLGEPWAEVGIAPDRRPVWPVGLAGSISHARGFVACILGRCPGHHPGVDVETLGRNQSVLAIRRIVLTEAERVLLRDQNPTLTTLVFSAKETLFKALYPMVGHHFGFEAAELVALPGATTLTLRLTRDLATRLPAGRSFAIACRSTADYVLTWLVVPLAGGEDC